MPKRFTDTDKWKKPFIKGLDGPYKLLWFYILDDCDHAGIWQVDFEVAQIRIGHEVNERTAISNFGDRIQIINNGSKWFLRDFIDFQYGQLNPSNRMHSSVINILKKNNISPYGSPLEGAKDIDKVQVMDKDKDKDKDRAWFESCIDDIFRETLKMTHKDKNLEQAISESWAYLSADAVRLKNSDEAAVKKLVNTWLSKMSVSNQQTKRIKLL